jgi:hypothetical protein
VVNAKPSRPQQFAIFFDSLLIIEYNVPVGKQPAALAAFCGPSFLKKISISFVIWRGGHSGELQCGEHPQHCSGWAW